MNMHRSRGLSTIAVITIGVITAFFSLVSLLTIRHLMLQWSPKLSQAEKQFKQRKYDAALDRLNRLDLNESRKPDAYTLLGKIWLAKAWKHLDETRWRDYGKNENDWLDLQQAAKSMKYLQRALKLNSSHLEAHYYLGIVYMEKGWYSKAEAEFISVLNLKPDFYKAYHNLGALYTRMDRLEDAETALRKAYALAPDNPSAAKNMAVYFRYHAKLPDSAAAWANRYLNLNHQKDIERALIKRDLLELLDRYPEITLHEKQTWRKKKRFEDRDLER
ncbi:MAG: tetratricopeptide repeat protein [Chitinivibrionales bacterium]|nr:tetratricopeptide repeat protein [Chitinivibrionales bacterium]